MRRPALTTATAVVATLALLAGCTGEGSDDDSPSDEETTAADDATDVAAETEPDEASIAAMDAVDVTWTSGEAPTVDVATPFEINAPLARLVTPGDGEEIGPTDIVALDFVTIDGADGSQLNSTYEASSELVILGDSSLVPAFTDIIVGQQVGAQVLFANVSTDSSLLMAIEIAERISPRAQGTAVEPAEGLPEVALAENGEPSITAVDGEPPADLVVQPLIEGDGELVEEGQYVLVEYSGWLWDGEQFDSSWSGSTPFSTQIGVGAVIEGWDTAIVGQPVGSQLLLVIPPELGYGEDGSGETIPGGATLVFVVDILHAGD